MRFLGSAIIAAVLAIEGAFASFEYKPNEASIFKESWRWTELEALSPYTVRQVAEAADGTLWFAVHGGIVKFDGYIATPYRYVDLGWEDANTLTVLVAEDQSIYAVTNKYAVRLREGEWHSYEGITRHSSSGSAMDESVDGSIWIAGMKGLYRIDGDNSIHMGETFNAVNSIIIDRQNRLWVADHATDNVHRYALDVSGNIVGLTKSFPTRFKGTDPISSFHEGYSGRMWITASSDTSALRYIDGDEVVTVLRDWAQFGEVNRLLSESKDGSVWLATSRTLGHFDGKNWTMERMDDRANWFTFLHTINDEVFITGGHTDKVYAFDYSDTRWKSYVGLNFGCQEADGATWFLSEDKRVVRRGPDGDNWQSFGVEDGLIDGPNALNTSSDGRVWASGSHEGMAAVSVWDGKNWKRNVHSRLGTLINHVSVFEGQGGGLYFGMGLGGGVLEDSMGGLIRYDLSSEELRFDYLGPPAYPRFVFGVAETSDGDLWMGGRSLHFKPKDGPASPMKRFQSFVIDNVVIDSDENVWIGDWRAGISRFDGANWERFSVSEGRARNELVSLLAGRRLPGVWAATQKGISRFDGHSWSSHTRFTDLKLQREGGRILESRNGDLWINSTPRSWNFNETLDPLETDIQFKTMRYHPDQSPPETRMVAFQEKLPESGNAYFEWSGVDKWSRTWSNDLSYSYRLNGGGWSPFQAASQVSIPSLASGDHRLEVRARDADWNIDPTPAVATFSVVPFVWKRGWFVATVGVTVGLIVLLAYLLVRTRVRHLIAIEEFKIDFFTNISHELRTPLAVILGPLESLLRNETRSKAKDKLDMAYRNARKMQGLVNQLLEFRKVELGKLKIEPIRSDIVLFLKDAIYSHASLWEKKRQHFSLHCGIESSLRCFDPAKLQHIVGNLISNAIKYTPDGGEIEVSIDIESPRSSKTVEYSLHLEVLDTGTGIDPSRHELIFKPFYRVHDQDKEHVGTGIGLAYTHELVSLWGGSISVESPVKRNGSAQLGGTRFHVTLPLSEDEQAATVDVTETLSGELPEAEVAREEADAGVEENASADRSRVLIVEDNSDSRHFLETELSDTYRVLTAEDGESGFEVALKRLPDLIVTDLMMPRVDGLEMCGRLKTNAETSHIPILMLTARVSDEYRLKGIANGADDYFAKPVNLAVLRARIESLLESRRRLREQFTRQIIVQPKEITVTSADERILTRAVEIVEEHMHDEDFDIDRFAELMGMARASLYRKLSAIVGQPPFKFIRSIRLKRAAQLLESGSLNVSETMELVGISGISYFGKIFRDEYGVSPSEYRKRFDKSGSESVGSAAMESH